MEIISGSDLLYWMKNNSARRATCGWLPEDEVLNHAVRWGVIKVHRVKHIYQYKTYTAFEFEKSESFNYDDRTGHFAF